MYKYRCNSDHSAHTYSHKCSWSLSYEYIHTRFQHNIIFGVTVYRFSPASGHRANDTNASVSRLVGQDNEIQSSSCMNQQPFPYLHNNARVSPIQPNRMTDWQCSGIGMRSKVSFPIGTDFHPSGILVFYSTCFSTFSGWYQD